MKIITVATGINERQKFMLQKYIDITGETTVAQNDGTVTEITPDLSGYNLVGRSSGMLEKLSSQQYAPRVAKDQDFRNYVSALIDKRKIDDYFIEAVAQSKILFGEMVKLHAPNEDISDEQVSLIAQDFKKKLIANPNKIIEFVQKGWIDDVLGRYAHYGVLDSWFGTVSRGL